MRVVCLVGLGLLFCARISGECRSTMVAQRVQTFLSEAIGEVHES